MENEFDDIKVKKFPQNVFTTLANSLTYDWEKFARCLSIDNSAIDNVKKKFETTREQTIQLLNQWRKNNPSKQWRDMKSGLLFCNRKDLVSECEQKLKSRHSVFGVLPPTKAFFSREEELNQIHKHVFQTNHSDKSFTVLTGMSGIGKTQLARKYAAIYSNHFESIVWVDAAKGKIQVSMINLCHLLGLNEKDSQGDPFDIEVVTRKIHNYFEREKTLYIFDNVDDESVKNFENYVSYKKNAFTLVTSQWKSWSTNVNQVEIKSFSPSDAFLFAKRNMKQILASDDDKLKEIAELLRYHPLAINQAILYINNNSISLQEYLDLFRSYPIEMLEEGTHTEAEAKSAITSISLVLCKIELSSDRSLEILHHLSYCDGQHIARKFIVGISKHLKINEVILINRAIRLLVSYSLLDHFEDDNDMYAMHEMTQLASKLYQKRREVTELYTENIVDFLRLQLEDVKEHVDDGKHFYNHFIHMFHINESKMCEVFHQQSWSIRCFISNKGFFQEVINILNAIKSHNTKSYGAENQITLNTEHIIALCLDDMGKHNEALEIYHHVDKIQTDTLSIDDTSTLAPIFATKNNIANCLNRMGKYNEALEIYYQLNKSKSEILGMNHQSTLDTKNNMAICLDTIGKFNEALELYYQVDKIQTEIFGIKHPSTFGTKNNIAISLKNMGKYNEALEVCYQVDKIQIDILGKNHPSTLKTKEVIAGCLDHMGKYNEALEIYYQVDKIQSDNFGINHSSTLLTKISIANSLNGLGKYNEALEIYYHADKILSDNFGINHPLTLSNKNSIAITLKKMGKYNEALEIYFQDDKIQTDILGIKHPSTLITKNNLANCLNEMGKYNEALDIFYQVDKIQNDFFGINHLSTLNTKIGIAGCWYGMGNYNEALEICYQIDKIQTDILGINHPSTLKTKNNIASCLKDMGKQNEALEIYFQVDKIQTDILGIKHPSTLNTKVDIAICLKEMGKCNEALDIFYQVDKLQIDIFGINHPLTLNTKISIASCLSEMGKYNEALDIFYHVDKTQIDNFGINHPSTLNTKIGIASCLYGMGNYNEALEICYQIDKIQTDILGINHPSTLKTKNNIASCLSEMGKFNEALDIFYQVDKIQVDNFGINHPLRLNTKDDIALCLKNMKL